MAEKPTARDIIESLVACHDEQSCPAVTLAREWLATVDNKLPRVNLNDDGSVRRYFINPENGYVVEADRGAWVRYVDHVAALAAFQAAKEKQQ